MNFKLTTLFLVLGFLIVSCKDKMDDPNPEPTGPQSSDIELVTGINMTDFSGAAISKVGNPNVKNQQIFLYPNPASDVISVSSQEALNSFFIINGEKNTDFGLVNYNDVLLSHNYEITDINNLQIATGTVSGNDLQINLEPFSTGYYRIFYTLPSGEIYWDNFYVNKEIPYPTMIDSLVSDWK